VLRLHNKMSNRSNMIKNVVNGHQQRYNV